VLFEDKGKRIDALPGGFAVALTKTQPRPLRADTWHLKGCPLFKGMDETTLSAAMAMGQIRAFDPGEMITPARLDEPALWVVKRGHIKINYAASTGKQVCVVMLHPGDMFGALSESDPEEYGENITALSSSCICRFPRRKFMEFLGQHPELASRVAESNMQRVQRVQIHLADAMTKPAESRLAVALDELAEAIGEESDAGVKLSRAVSHQELAELIGTSREMVSHIMTRLRDRGVIAVEKRRVTVLDREQLRSLAEGDL